MALSKDDKDIWKCAIENASAHIRSFDLEQMFGADIMDVDNKTQNKYALAQEAISRKILSLRRKVGHD